MVILNMWVNYGVKLMELGIPDGLLGFTEAVMAVARSLQNPVGRTFIVEKWKNYCISRMNFGDYLTRVD